MSQSDRSSRIFDASDEELLRYRAPSSLAVAGLLAGLLSPLAMLSLWLWPAPLAAVVLSGLALWRFAARRPDLAGRPAALAGLMLGTAFLVAAPLDDLVYRYCLRRQARQFAQIWVDAVSQGEVYKAHHLMVAPKQRWPLDSDLAAFYRQNEKWRSLDSFVQEPTMRTLFALFPPRTTGPAATIRFYETEAEGPDLVKLAYAVTYPGEGGQPTSFFITLLVQRFVDTGSGRADWTLVRVEGGVRPRGW